MGRMANSGRPALLLTTWSDSEAEMVRQLLASYGITCSVASQVPHSILPLTVDGLGEIRVHVPPSALQEARQILAAHRLAGRETPRKETAQGTILPMAITVHGATRIDLAGGTLDIWPLYLFLQGPVTVNLAIDRHVMVEVSIQPGHRVFLRSEDLDLSVTAEGPGDLDLDGPLRLLARLARAFAPEGGIRLRTASSVPPGSGLGGSSALAAAAAVALGRLGGEPCQRRDLHGLARHLSNLEAQVLGIPTGVQDYYPALMGGALALSFTPAGVSAEPLSVPAEDVENRLVLAYEGTSRSSGVSNLDMVRRFFDGDTGTRSGLEQVAAAARTMARCLRTGDLDAAGKAMDAEMAGRRQLSPHVMTPATEALFKAARDAGALGAKVCGAGGGGCSVYWCRPAKRDAVGRAVEKAGGQLFPFHVEQRGLVPAGATRPT
ncbi:MAG: putative signal transducing protein [Acidobacteriota bacterium]